MQTELNLLDLGTLIALVSTVVAILGFGYTWIVDKRSERMNMAMDALANRLIPFYAIVLESMSKINLYLMAAQSVRYSTFRIDPEELYRKAADAFVYIQAPKDRQLVINTIQVVQTLDELERRADAQQMAEVLADALPLFGMMKNQIEVYLEAYAKAMALHSPEIPLPSRTADVHAEGTLKRVLELLNQ